MSAGAQLKGTESVQIKFVLLLMLPAILAGCLPTTEASETERALCEAWAESLPTRSREDTEQTQEEIGRSYDAQAAACPGMELYSPKSKWAFGLF
jgi:hypothetical protein